MLGLACAAAEPSYQRSLPELTTAFATDAAPNQDRILTLGDIDADDPGGRIERLRLSLITCRKNYPIAELMK